MSDFYSCDFETTVLQENDIGIIENYSTNVWLWCIYSDDVKITGSSVADFLDSCYCLQKKKTIFSFFNLSFDGAFIIDYLLKNGFVHYDDALKSNFTSDPPNNMLVVYKQPMAGIFWIKVKFRDKILHFKDSAKRLGGSIAEHGKKLGLLKHEDENNTLDIFFNDEIIGKYKGSTPLLIRWDSDFKLHPDYDKWVEYCFRDCEIDYKMNMYVESLGLDKWTRASNAMSSFKKIYNLEKEDNFRAQFPLLRMNGTDDYRGAYCYVNPLYAGKSVTDALYIDIKSMYPHKMRNYEMPYGYPQNLDLKGTTDLREFLIIKEYCKYFVMNIYIDYTIPDYNPPMLYIDKEYKYRYCGVISLTNIDFDILQEIATIHELKIYTIQVYKTQTGMFDKYIDHWFEVKEKAESAGDQVLRYFAKIMLNAFYGKWGSKAINELQCPYLKGNIISNRKIIVDGSLHYLPVASATTAYSRQHLYNIIKSVGYSNIVYNDTDSAVIIGDENSIKQKLANNNIFYGDNIGDYGIEHRIIKGEFYSKKRYKLLNDKGKVIVKCVGIKQSVFDGMSYDEVKLSNAIFEQYKMTTMSGGKALVKKYSIVK